jgi:anti-sigma B factor antagonist
MLLHRLHSIGVTTSSDFDVRLETMPAGAAVLYVSGELDLASAPRLEEAIADAPPTAPVVIELSGCTFLDSAGIRTLVSAATARPEGRVDVVTTDPGILRVLEITGVDTVLAVHPSVDAAL